MDDREFENLLGRVMKADLASGTEAFRDALLSRCLAELGTDPHAADCVPMAVPVAEADLDLLAAAGDSTTQLGRALGDNGLLGD